MTRRLSLTLFFCAIIGVIIAGIAGAAAESGARTDIATLKEDQRSFRGSTVEDGDDATVAVIPIRGVITGGDSNPNGSSVGADDVVALIDAVVESDEFDAILLELNTPGGGVLASAEIADAVKRARQEDLKVVAWMRESAASGGYYISAPADHIIASKETITGSIGVILEYVQVAKLADDIGVKPVVVKSGKLKDMGSPFRDLTPEEQRLLQEMIDEAYGGFVEVVAKGRDMSEGEVRELADGRIYTGTQAEENGLVDELGLRDDAYEAVAKLLDEDADELEVVEYERSFSFGELLSASSNDMLSAAGVGRAATDIARAALGGDSALGLSTQAGGPRPFISLEYRAEL